MFEREIKFIYDFNLNKVKQLGANLTFETLAAAPLHPAILQYISAEIDYLVYEDRQKLLRNSNFDYSGEEITKYFQQISGVIKKEKRLALDYVDQLILQASSFTINYLIQPNWSLAKFIFDKEDVIETAKARQIFNYIYYYKYIQNITEKYFNAKNLEEISRTEFLTLLQKIDTEVFSAYAEQMLDKVLVSMGDFFNTGNVDKSKIPLAAAETFLKEKNLNALLQRVTDACYPEPKTSYSISEIKIILFSPVPIKKDRYIDRAVKQDIPASVFVAPEESTEPEGQDEAPFQDELNNKEPIIQEPETADEPVQPELITPEPEIPEQNSTDQDEVVLFEIPEPDRIPEPEQEPEQIQIPESEQISEHRHMPAPEETPEPEQVPEPEQIPEPDETPRDEQIPDPEQISESGINAEPEEPGQFTEDDQIRIINETSEPEPEDELLIVEDDDSDESSGEGLFIIDTREEAADFQPGPEQPSEPDQQELQNINPAEEEPQPEESLENQKDIKIIPERKNYIEEPVAPWKISSKKKEISSFISGKDMENIIEYVFNEDTEDFALTLERLADARTEPEAVSMFEKVLNSYRIKPSSKYAQVLRKVIHDYFNQ